MTRGIRNNNPFNIRRTKISWLGESEDCIDNDFEVFKDIVYGVRAGVKLLTNYVRNGYDTPTKILYRFAPPNENDTKKYLEFLFNEGYISSYNEKVSVGSPALFSLCRGICYYESKFTLTNELYSRSLHYL